MNARDHISDWITQRWVVLTGRQVDLEREPWLSGPVGKPTGIGPSFFDDLARASGFTVRRNGASRGLLQDVDVLAGPSFDPATIDAAVVDFYEHTATFDLDAWAEWCGAFRPFGGMLARLFSRRLQQLNVPLSALDTSRGITSEIVQLVDPASGAVVQTGWVRELMGTGNVLYAGSYSTCRVPGYDGTCVKVVFPLPNGNAMVILKPIAHPDGSLSVVSSGRRFGDPGFYFTVHREDGRVSARYVRAMQETIHVYPGEGSDVRADHVMTLWGLTFLRLHYRMSKQVAARPATRPHSSAS